MVEHLKNIAEYNNFGGMEEGEQMAAEEEEEEGEASDLIVVL